MLRPQVTLTQVAWNQRSQNKNSRAIRRMRSVLPARPDREKRHVGRFAGSHGGGQAPCRAVVNVKLECNLVWRGVRKGCLAGRSCCNGGRGTCWCSAALGGEGWRVKNLDGLK